MSDEGIVEETPCEKCEMGICHNHGAVHIPGCWRCVWSDTGKHPRGCYCDRSKVAEHLGGRE